MKTLVTALLLTASILIARSATAEPFTVEGRTLPIGLGNSLVVPTEWAGIWSIEDSTYDCTGAFKSTSSSVDTLCAGHGFAGDPTFTCTGSATPTTFNETCTGSFVVFPDCQANFVVETHGTRTNDTYYAVATLNVTYSGTGSGCDLLPPTCTQVNSRGTRTAPAPAAYCASPAKAATWGALKVQYR